MGITIVDDFRVGDFVQVSGETYFSGVSTPQHPVDMSLYTNKFGRVGVVKNTLITLNGHMTITVDFWTTGEVSNFAAYQLKKLDKISPYL